MLEEFRIPQMWENQNLTFKLIAEKIKLIEKKHTIYVIAYNKKKTIKTNTLSVNQWTI